MPRRPKIRTPEARKLVKDVISELFDDSQAMFAEKSGLDIATVFRLVKGQRPTTPEQIGRIIAVLPRNWALRLMKAFLSDVAAASAPGFAVTVSKS